MQLLPLDTPLIGSAASHLDNVLASAVGAGEEYLNKGNDFLTALNQELAQAGVTPLDVEAGDGAPRGFRSQESEKTLNGEDLGALRAALKKRGVQEADMAAIDALLESGSVTSMGGLMAALAGFRRTGPELSAAESEKLDSVLRTLRFSEEEIASLREQMESGAIGQAMKSIRSRLGEMGGESMDIGRDELSALLRGLDLTDATRNAILSRFGNSGERSLTTEEFQGLLGPAGAEMTRKENSRQAIAAELRAALDEVLRTKKQREDAESLSDARGSKKADRAETRMRDAMSAKGMGMGPEALARRMREDAEALNAGDVSGDPEHKAYAFVQRESNASGGNAGGNADGNAGGAKAWLADSETRKNNASGDSHSSFTAAFSRVTAEGMFSGAAQSGAARTNTPLPRSMNEEIFAQVQKGILKELGDGSRQLTLRLDPAELGQVSVMLTVNKGEVRAVLRAESAEASAALSEQMSQLKASLEEQGLKVSQLEVQTRLGDETPAREWGGNEFHNQEHEMREQARFQQLARMRREAAEELAQDMQNIRQREENSRSGLHIVA